MFSKITVLHHVSCDNTTLTYGQNIKISVVKQSMFFDFLAVLVSLPPRTSEFSWKQFILMFNEAIDMHPFIDFSLLAI